jgi:hypothetical protein
MDEEQTPLLDTLLMLGDRVVTGSATPSGSLNLRIRYPHVKADAGWHYRGMANRAQHAMGGIWGMSNVDRQSAMGTFFFYKL